MIRNAKPGDTLWDKGDRGSVKGLHLRVSDQGKKVFLLYYRSKQGKQRRPKLGDFGQLTLADARRLAKKLMDRVAIGEDPKGEWEAKKSEITVGDLFQKVYTEHWSKPRFIASGHQASVLHFWTRHLEQTFSKYRLSEVTAPLVRRWHSDLLDTPYAANRSLEVLGRIFSYAVEHELKPQGTNPCRLVRKHPEQKRKRYATEEELKQINEILKKESHRRPAAVAFLYLLLFTGSRPRAIERATWDQLQRYEKDGITYGILSFAGKTSADSGENESVVIPPQAMELIDQLPRLRSTDSIIGMKIPRRLWSSIKKKVGCTDLRMRDFRRTFATIAMSNGEGTSQIGEILNHKTPQTTKIYAKLMDDSRVNAVLRIANQVESVLKSG